MISRAIVVLPVVLALALVGMERNWAAKWLDKLLGCLPPADLSFQYLQQHAMWRCDFDGVDSFSNYSSLALEALTRAIAVDRPPLTPLGRWTLHESLISTLCMQLQLRKMELARPDIFAQTQVRQVVFVAGAPYTGVQELMRALCERNASLTCVTLAEALEPLAPVYLASRFFLGPLDIRFWKALAWTTALGRQFLPNDPPSPTSCSEHSLLEAAFFGSRVFFSALPLPTYERWFRENTHQLQLELEVKKLLQVIQHERGDRSGKVWVLPQHHLHHTPAKQLVYPEARFVLTKRNAAEAVAEQVATAASAMQALCHPVANHQAHAKIIADHHAWSSDTALQADAVVYYEDLFPRNEAKFPSLCLESLEMLGKYAGPTCATNGSKQFPAFAKASAAATTTAAGAAHRS
ncbi:hypothetical protein BASA81_003627 [Batrachochytrium salamandrivorans]|nr:hypothetical protein BASA81_003627 [Batrachochytrium salamandrivorans]